MYQQAKPGGWTTVGVQQLKKIFMIKTFNLFIIKTYMLIANWTSFEKGYGKCKSN